MKTLLSICALGLTLGFAPARADDAKKEEKKDATVAKEEKKAEPAAASEVAVIKTSEGEMVAEFWPDVAPKTVENFKTLSKKGFYNGTIFHRIIKGFMIQGGDPLSKDPANAGRYGTGDPGYKINAEFNARKHVRGVLSMARNGDPKERFGAMPGPEAANSAGSQFFICLEPAPNLDGRYTTFGKLIKGEDVLLKIGETPVNGDQAAKRVEIQSIKIVPADSVK